MLLLLPCQAGDLSRAGDSLWEAEKRFPAAKLRGGGRSPQAFERGDFACGELIERNLRLVVHIAKRFENTGVFIEDLVSIGTIGLIKAVNTFKPERNIKLAICVQVH